MKTILMALALAFTMSANAAYFLPDLTPVGELDTFIAEDAKQGNPAAEELWAEGVTGAALDWANKVTDVAYSETDALGVYAFEMGNEPDYFILKNSTRVAIFQNNELRNWGVFDSYLLSDAMNLPSDPYMISHVSTLNDPCEVDCGPSTNRVVPEPSIPMLLGVGLIGFGFTRKLS